MEDIYSVFLEINIRFYVPVHMIIALIVCSAPLSIMISGEVGGKFFLVGKDNRNLCSPMIIKLIDTKTYPEAFFLFVTPFPSSLVHVYVIYFQSLNKAREKHLPHNQTYLFFQNLAWYERRVNLNSSLDHSIFKLFCSNFLCKFLP